MVASVATGPEEPFKEPDYTLRFALFVLVWSVFGSVYKIKTSRAKTQESRVHELKYKSAGQRLGHGAHRPQVLIPPSDLHFNSFLK